MLMLYPDCVLKKQSKMTQQITPKLSESLNLERKKYAEGHMML